MIAPTRKDPDERLLESNLGWGAQLADPVAQRPKDVHHAHIQQTVMDAVKRRVALRQRSDAEGQQTAQGSESARTQLERQRCDESNKSVSDAVSASSRP